MLAADSRAVQTSCGHRSARASRRCTTAASSRPVDTGNVLLSSSLPLQAASEHSWAVGDAASPSSCLSCSNVLRLK